MNDYSRSILSLIISLFLCAYCSSSAFADEGDFVIPENTTVIDDEAFANCLLIESITIPESVTKIGDGAFFGCTHLSDVFYKGTAMQWRNTMIGNDNAPLLDANIHCLDVAPVIIDSGMCGESLTWTLDSDGVLMISGNGEMNGYSQNLFGTIYDPPWMNRRANINTIIVEEGVTSIGNCAFYQCENAEYISLPKSLTMIGQSAFYYCEKLTHINIPVNVAQIGNSAFRACKGLVEVIIPDGVTHIGSRAFQDCSNLEKIIMPNSVTTLGDSLFVGCSSISTAGPLGSECDYQFGWDIVTPQYAFSDLENLEYIVFPESITKIGHISDCSSLKDIYYEGSEISWDNISKQSFTGVNIHYSIESSFETPFSSSSVNIGIATVNLKKGFNFIHADSSQPNSELALSAVTLSAQVYKNAQGMKTEGILHELGYDTTGFSNSDSSFAHPGVCFGYKQINNGKNLFAVVVRGTDTTDDLIDVWTDLEDGALSMFRVSSEYVEAQLEDFMESATGKTVVELQQEDNYFFLTGHSLGGAIANCLSVNGNIMKFAGSDKGKIYTYTFESPHTCENLWWTDPESESNAFNYKVDGDAVTNLPPYAGSTTYGKDVWIRVSELDDDLFNELFPDSLCKTLAIATSVDGHGDSFGLHDVCLDLVYVVQHR